MKSTRLLLTALALAGAPVLAARADETGLIAPAAVAPAAPKIDEQALALLDQTVAAYAQTPSLSQEVQWKFAMGRETSESQGHWYFQRPGKARLERTLRDGKMLVVGNGKTLIGQWGEDIAPLEGDAIAETAEYLFIGPLSPMSLIFQGFNPLRFPVDLGWKSATVMPDGKGIVFKVQADETGPVETLNLRFDPATHLITLATAEVVLPAQGPDPSRKFSVNVSFKTQPSNLTPALFEFKLPAGQTLKSLSQKEINYDPKLVTGASPFALTGQTLEGKTLSLDDYKGKVVLLDFWATWCGPCVEELPMVRATYNRYHNEGFEVVGVSLDEEESDLRDFIKKRAMPWPQIFDKEPFRGPNATNYSVAAIPFTLLIGKDGKILDVNPRGYDLPLAVEKALQTPAS